jgi:membrane protease YdiL (CAAX protease family)
MWMTVVVSPVAEEVLFRGYLFRQLHVHGRWPFWLAVLMNAAPFVWGHLYQAAQSSQAALGVLWVGLIMGIGAAAFSWVFIHWDYNLWFPIGLHSAMNLWWYLFNADESAFGGWSGNVARAMTLGLAIAITLRREALTEWLRSRLGRGGRLTSG